MRSGKRIRYADSGYQYREHFAMTLRRLYQIDGWLMIAIGIMFFRYVNDLAEWFGIDTSGPLRENLDLWRAVSFGGVFGGALIALGLSALAMSRSKDPAFHRATGWYWAGYRDCAKRLAFCSMDSDGDCSTLRNRGTRCLTPITPINRQLCAGVRTWAESISQFLWCGY
jgi:hypothetical protein